MFVSPATVTRVTREALDEHAAASTVIIIPADAKRILWRVADKGFKMFIADVLREKS